MTADVLVESKSQAFLINPPLFMDARLSNRHRYLISTLVFWVTKLFQQLPCIVIVVCSVSRALVCLREVMSSNFGRTYNQQDHSIQGETQFLMFCDGKRQYTGSPRGHFWFGSIPLLYDTQLSPSKELVSKRKELLTNAFSLFSLCPKKRILANFKDCHPE